MKFKPGDRVQWSMLGAEGRVIGKVIEPPTTPPATMGPVIAVRSDEMGSGTWSWIAPEDLEHVPAVDRLGEMARRVV